MAWNVFKFCTALRALGSIMILFVLAIIGVTYYAVVVAHYGPSLFLGGSDTVYAVVVLFLFHFLVYPFLLFCYLLHDFICVGNGPIWGIRILILAVSFYLG